MFLNVTQNVCLSSFNSGSLCAVHLWWITETSLSDEFNWNRQIWRQFCSHTFSSQLCSQKNVSTLEHSYSIWNSTWSFSSNIDSSKGSDGSILENLWPIFFNEMNDITSNFLEKTSNFMEEMSETPQSSSAEIWSSISIFVWSWVFIVLKFIHVRIFHVNIDVSSVAKNLLSCSHNLVSVIVINIWTCNRLIFSFILSQIGIEKSCSRCTVLLIGDIFNYLVDWNWNVEDLISSEFDLNPTFMSVMECSIDIDLLLSSSLQ